MDAGGSLLLRIIDQFTFRDAVQAAHDCRLDEADRPVNIVVLDARDQNLFAFLQEVLLDRADVLDVTDVLVEARINGHVFGPHSESFPVLVLIFYVQNEGDASRVLPHHLLEEAHRQVNSFDH